MLKRLTDEEMGRRTDIMTERESLGLDLWTGEKLSEDDLIERNANEEFDEPIF